MTNQYVNDFNETTQIYYDNLKKCKPLTKRKERKLFKQCKKGNIKAKNEILEANLRFVFDIAKRYTGRGVPISDLISDGNMGLIKAIDKFDNERDIKFISYAVWWIRQSILEGIKKRKLLDTIELKPSETNESVMERKLSDDEDEHVSYYEVMFLNCHEDDVKDINEGQKNIVKTLLDSLDEREKDVIKNFYGLDNRKELSLTELSKEYGISVERVRQIKLTAIRKLRSNAMLLNENVKEILS